MYTTQNPRLCFSPDKNINLENINHVSLVGTNLKMKSDVFTVNELRKERSRKVSRKEGNGEERKVYKYLGESNRLPYERA